MKHTMKSQYLTLPFHQIIPFHHHVSLFFMATSKSSSADCSISSHSSALNPHEISSWIPPSAPEIPCFQRLLDLLGPPSSLQRPSQLQPEIGTAQQHGQRQHLRQWRNAGEAPSNLGGRWGKYGGFLKEGYITPKSSISKLWSVLNNIVLHKIPQGCSP